MEIYFMAGSPLFSSNQPCLFCLKFVVYKKQSRAALTKISEKREWLMFHCPCYPENLRLSEKEGSAGGELSELVFH